MFEQVCNQKPLLVRELRFGFVPGPRRSRLGFTVTGSLALHWPTPFRAPPMQSNCQLPQKSDLKLVLIIPLHFARSGSRSASALRYSEVGIRISSGVFSPSK